jgi:hypothetical protein
MAKISTFLGICIFVLSKKSKAIMVHKNVGGGHKALWEIEGQEKYS